MEQKIKFKTVEEYFSAAPPHTLKPLRSIRKIIRKAAPEAAEVISYNMPAFSLGGILVYYAAFQHHLGFYPTAAPIEAFKDELIAYVTSKGTIQFPLDKPLPDDLITRIVKFRIRQVQEKNAAKKVKN